MPGCLPLLLLDVDGVLNPYAATSCPPGYTEYSFFPGEDPVRVCAAHGPWLAELADRFRLVWATAWQTEANRLLGPLLALPELPVLKFPIVASEHMDKLPTVIDFARQEPLAWIDDMLTPAAHAWAAGRAVPTLLVGINPAQGLTRAAIEQAVRWAESL